MGRFLPDPLSISQSCSCLRLLLAAKRRIFARVFYFHIDLLLYCITMVRHRFSKKLEYKVFDFMDAPGIVMTSFFSQMSISHLDLQISQRTPSEMWNLKIPYRCTFSTEKSFFCSKESLRNNLVPRRRLLYTLHLDLPEGREHSSLKYRPRLENLKENSESLFVAFCYKTTFLEGVLLNLLRLAIEKTDSKLKLLNWIVDFRRLQKGGIPTDIQISCAKLLYSERVDSQIVTKFLRRKIIDRQMFWFADELKVFEFLLKSARLWDFDVRIITTERICLVDLCILSNNFRNSPSFLKYEDSAFYTEESYNKYLGRMSRNGRRYTNLNPAENRMDKLRLQRILQIIYIFRHLEGRELPVRTSALEALRLVWSSIPDSFVSLKEMNDAYEGLLNSNLIREAHSFYQEAIRQTVSSPQPRPLTQHCRCLIRKCMYQRKQWLPDGIKQLQLPPRFESFLNLQRDDLQPGITLDSPETS